jgi:hypothetical protein
LPVGLSRCGLEPGHDPGQGDGDGDHRGAGDPVDRAPAEIFRDDPGPDAGDQYPEDHAGGESGGDMAEPLGRDALGGVGGQQIGRDGEEAEQGGSGGEQHEVLRQRHHPQADALARGEQYRQPPVGKAVAERQQQENAHCQRQLVERRDQSDRRRADPEALGHFADDRVDVIGIGGHHRSRERRAAAPAAG